MSYYRNQELSVSAKFVGVADDGKIQVKIKGIDNVIFNVDAKHVSDANGGGATSSPVKSSNVEEDYVIPTKRKSIKKEKKKKRKQSALEAEADAAWGSDEDDTAIPTKTKPVDDAKEDPIAEEPEQEEAANNAGPTDVKLLDASDVSLGDERFHHKHKFKTMTVEQGGSLLATTESKDVQCGFGTVECNEEDKVYHWKLQILEGDNLHFGIIFSDMAKKSKRSYWWLADEGYSYWGDDGMVYHSDKYKKYGEKYGAGDIIDVYLNTAKYNVAFGYNGNKYKKAFKINKEKAYRLAVAALSHPTKVQMIKFEVTDKS